MITDFRMYTLMPSECYVFSFIENVILSYSPFHLTKLLGEANLIIYMKNINYKILYKHTW